MHNPNDPVDEERNAEETPPLPFEDATPPSKIRMSLSQHRLNC